MMDRFDAMAMLAAAVEGGSLSAASRNLGVPLATVSRTISDLEAHLKTRLLVRTSRKLSLTDAGATYLAAARRILEEVREAERAAAGEFSTPRGELTVAAPILFGRRHVLPIVSAFLRDYPQIEVRLTLSDRNMHVLDDHIDVAARIGTLPDSSLIATRIGELRRVVCASPELLAIHGVPRTPQDLAALPAVTFAAPGSSESWSFAGGIVVPMRARLTVNTAEAAVDAAISGVGVTRVLSYQSAAAVAEGRLAIVLADAEPAPIPVHLPRAEPGVVAAKVRAFLDFATPRLKAALAAL